MCSSTDIDEESMSLDEFAAAWAAHEQMTARLALTAARLELSGEYAADGTLTMASWLRNNCRMGHTAASLLLRRGRFLHRHEPFANAALSGTLSASQIEAFRTNVKPATASVFAEQAETLIDIIAPLDVRATELAAQAWRQAAEAVTEQPEPVVPERELSTSRTSDGTLIGRFVFDPTLAAEFEHAIETALAWDGSGDTRSTAVRQADAMFDIVAFFNANHDRTGTPRHRPHIEISLDADTLTGDACCASTNSGNSLTKAATEAFLCDSAIQRFVMSGSIPLDIGRSTRVVPLDLFRAVAKRDGGCRHPGCNRKVAWCDAHHIRHWRHGGATSLDNLVLLCSRHHHLIHTPGWQLKLLPDGTVELTAPDGRTLTGQPRGRPPTSQLPLAA